MSYHGMGLDPVLTPGMTLTLTPTSTLNYATTRTASTTPATAGIGFSGEKGRLNALKIMLRPYLVAMQDAVTSRSLSLAEKAVLAERLRAARKLASAIELVRPAAAGWIRADIDKLATIHTSGYLPTADDMALLLKSGNTAARDFSGQIAQAWNDLVRSLSAGGLWPSSRPSGGATINVGGRVIGTTGNPLINKSVADAGAAAAAADQARRELDAANARRDAEAAAIATRAEADAAAAQVAALQEAVAQAAATASAETAALQAALQQAEAIAAEAAQRVAEEARKKSKLWLWGLGAVVVAGAGYMVLRKK